MQAHCSLIVGITNQIHIRTTLNVDTQNTAKHCGTGRQKHRPPRQDMNICGKTLLGASWWRTHRRNWRATLRQFPGTTTPLL